MTTHKLTDTEIQVRVVPTHMRWPERGTTVVWSKLHDAVDALQNVVRDVDQGCLEAEQDPELSAGGIARRRIGLGEQALRQLADFKPVLTAERAVNENIDKFESKMQTSLTTALGEMQRGVDAARRAVIERCQMRAFAP